MEEEMAVVGGLSAAMLEAIESMGRYFEQYGLARIGGRLVGLLTLTDQPLTLDAMAAALGVSRASVSTNIRLLVAYGLAELVSFPGDRRDYYRFAENAWERGIIVNIEGTEALRRIAERGLAGVTHDDGVALARLTEMVVFCDFFIEEQRATLERWRARQHNSAARLPRPLVEVRE
jgi:biotin operon repressor